MIETIASNVVRCDCCNLLLETGTSYKHLFQKDVCDKCMGIILQKIESERVMSKEQFNEILDDIRYKI